MKSARRKKFAKRWREARSGAKIGRNSGIFIKLLILLGIIASLVLFVKLRTFYWNGSDKIAFAFRQGDGNVGVTVLDPKLTELTTLVIPGDTQVDVAENYGTMRLKNVWALSQNEKLKGKLLPETITQNFLFPTFLWADSEAEGIGSSNFPQIVKFIFDSGGTNIPFGDRINIGLFALKLPSLGRGEINLGESQYLKKQKLNDGLTGYLLTGPISSRLTVYFSDNDLSQASAKVSIIDATGSPGAADKVGQIVEVLGGKVVSIDKKDSQAIDCEVVGSNPKIVDKIVNLFNCRKGVGKTDFDLEIRLGSNFAKRF